MGIQRLPTAVVSSLRTDVTVTTTAQCVTELVLNSIDAGAQAIAVRIDLRNFRIQVIDNGCGLSSSDLNVIGLRYMTSKCHSLVDLQKNLGHFGFRGEAIASIAEVCGNLTIVSRCHDSEKTLCKVFTQGIGHNVGNSRQQRASPGTTITVADFLYNRPVRKARIKPALDLEEVKVYMESIALINPNVSISLRNDVNNEILMQTKRSGDIPTVFSSLFGESVSKYLTAVKEQLGPFKVEGFIAREAHSLKNLQFIYVNKRLLLKTKLHRLVNSIMARSAILKSNNVPYAPISKEMNHGVFLAFSPPKRDKHAIYLLNITCPYSEYDITLDPKKTLVEFCDWDSVLSCFESLLRKFIEEEAEPEKDSNFDSAPPRKLRNVVDEINELAREAALKRNIQSAEESISTKDLPRAVHGLPAIRDKVDIYPDPSENGSSSSSSSTVSSAGEKTIPSTVLTEKPYPFTEHPFRNNKILFGAKSVSNVSVFSTSPDSASKPKYSTQQFEDPHSLLVPSKSLKKGFLIDTVHFQESFRRTTNQPVKSISETKAAVSTPIDALANIKEIRRKKLLNNLNKFSFKVACEKPVLHKAPVSKNKLIKSFVTTQVDINKVLSNQDTAIEIHEPKIGVSKPVEATFTPLTSNYIEDENLMASQIATIQSSALCESTNLGTERSLNFQAVTDPCVPSYLKSRNSARTDASTVECYQNFQAPKVSEMGGVKSNGINTLSGVRNRQQFWQGSEQMESSQHIPNFPDTIAFDDVFPLHHNDSKFVSIEGLSNSPKDVTSISEIKEANGNSAFLQDIGQCSIASLSDSLSNQNLLNTRHDTDQILLKKKLVDYDSSPPSSQEPPCNVQVIGETNLVNLSQLKRKQDSTCEQIPKKVFLAEEDSEICHFDESQSIDDTYRTSTFVLPPTAFSLEESGKNCDAGNQFSEESSNTLSKVSAEVTVPTDLNSNKSEVVLAPHEEICDERGVSTDLFSEESCNNSNNEWIKNFDDCGKVFYFHKVSGVTTYLKPNQENNSTFKFTERFGFLPKGMSPILKDKCTNELSNSPSITQYKLDEDLSAVKWNKEPTGKKDFWPLIDQLLAEADKFSTNINSESQVKSATFHDTSQSDIKTYNAVFPYSFSKDVFNNLRVLGQLDNKFIVTVAVLESNREVIVLFDQHAVHERIRVEHLTEEYQQHDGTAIWRSAPVDPELPLQLSSIEVRILDSYKDKMEQLGFSFGVDNANTINIQRVPTCLLLRENREVNSKGVSVLRQHLESLIREQVDSLLNTRGVGTDHPTIIRNVISSEACRGAVKFGHSLSVADCQAFLHNLSSCNLPFQCAHGRPALMPIVDLSLLKKNKQLQKPNLLKLKRSH